MIPDNRLLLHSSFKKLINDDRVNIVDVGAREELFAPYNKLPQDLIKVFGFEPDAKEAERLKNLYKPEEREYFPFGLWNKTTDIKLSYSEVPGNSSIHPPNMERLKELFPPINWKTRTPKEILTLGVKSIDDINAETPFDCDLLKVDTQGSEYEILVGAEKFLKSNVSFVLLETWTFEVHKDQALSGKIMEWMNERGFTLIRLNNGAEWERKTDKPIPIKGMQTLVGLDLLFVRNEFKFDNPSFQKSKIVKAAALAELYGFPDLGIQILETWSDSSDENAAKAKSIIYNNWQKSHDPILLRVLRKTAWNLGFILKKRNSNPYAPLH